MAAEPTFDLIDAPLWDAYGQHQGLPDSARFKIYRREFCVDPQNWVRHVPPQWVFELNWRNYHYPDVQQRDELNDIIPESDPGIYIFYTCADHLILGLPKFALYVGISNERNSERPLRDRLKEYVPTALNKIKKRKNIHLMLQLYYQQIWVAFALAPFPSEELERAEELLHGFLYPCFGRRDFPVDIKRQQQAFGVI